MGLFTVDEATCTRCGICVDECPVGGIIELREGSSVPTSTVNAGELCITCGHCVAVCPYGSFSLAAMPVEDCPTLDRSRIPLPEQVDHLMRARRSIRRYKDATVDSEIIASIIDTASHAPTGRNMQGLEWLVVYNRDQVGKLSEMTIQWMKYLEKEKHPAAEMFGVSHLIAAWRAGVDPICRNAPHLIVVHAKKDVQIASIDSAAALSWMDLAASSQGLGTCWAGFVMACAMWWPPIQEALALPEGNVLTGAMMIGYPKYEYYRLPLRKEPSIDWR